MASPSVLAWRSSGGRPCTRAANQGSPATHRGLSRMPACAQSETSGAMPCSLRAGGRASRATPAPPSTRGCRTSANAGQNKRRWSTPSRSDPQNGQS
eukprot:280525-Alexandrium_andersonii.AAC.1